MLAGLDAIAPSASRPFHMRTETSFADHKSFMRTAADSWIRDESTIDFEYPRYSVTSRLWFSDAKLELPLDPLKSVTRRYLYDGTTAYDYSENAAADSYKVLMSGATTNGSDFRNNALSLCGGKLGPLSGFYLGSFESVSSVVSTGKLTDLGVAGVGGNPCRVIAISTTHGQYRFWVDPNHGFLVLQAELTISQGNDFYNQPLGVALDDATKAAYAAAHVPTAARTGVHFRLHDVCLSQAAGAWVAVGGSWDSEEAYSDNTSIVRHARQVRSDIIIGASAIGADAFTPRFHNGATFKRDGAINVFPLRWEDGRPVPLVDEDLERSINRMMTSQKLRAEPTGAGRKWQVAVPLGLSAIVVYLVVLTSMRKRDVPRSRDSTSVSHPPQGLTDVACEETCTEQHWLRYFCFWQ